MRYRERIDCRPSAAGAYVRVSELDAGGNGVKLILAVDAIKPPLTGIGRYAWELASHYQRPQQGLKSVRFFLGGRWVADPATLLLPPPVPAPKRKRQTLRAPASWRRWRMRCEMRGHVFHSPNYFLPASVESGIVTIHDLSVFKYPETHPLERIRQFERGFTLTLSRAVHLITDSEAIRSEIVDQYGWSADKVTAIHLGVSPEFRPRGPEEVADMLRAKGLVFGCYALCVSTLEPRKRISHLLAAYRALPRGLRNRYPLVLAGSRGWLSDGLLKQIEEGERQGWLRYVGFVPESFLPALYAGARAFLFPSVYEGFGLPVLEALASGVPTLTSHCSSLPEVANGAAWLVEPDDHEALRDGIEHVLCDETWRASAVQRGLHVAAQYTWAACASRTLELCRRFA